MITNFRDIRWEKIDKTAQFLEKNIWIFWKFEKRTATNLGSLATFAIASQYQIIGMKVSKENLNFFESQYFCQID